MLLLLKHNLNQLLKNQQHHYGFHPLTEDFLTPIRFDTSNTGNGLELGEYNEETFPSSKSSFKKKFFLF
jgi:hypothetical protein